MLHSSDRREYDSVQELQTSSMRPPTKASSECKASKSTEHSVQSHFQFFHGKSLHSLRCRLGFEDARLLGEWVDAFLGWAGRLLLQLQVQETRKFEVSVLLDFSTCNRKKSLNDTLHLLVLQCTCFGHRGNDLSLSEHSCRLFGNRLHGGRSGGRLHCFHCWCHDGEANKPNKK